MNLRTALAGCSSGQLARIAAAWKVAVEAGTLRRELVELLATRIVDEADAATTWAGLGVAEAEVVRLLVRAGGRHEEDLLLRRLGSDLSAGHDADGVRADVEAALRDLVERGLLYRVFDADEQRRGVYLALPDELLVTARQRVGGSVRAEPDLPAADLAPERVAHAKLAVDLFVLASALRREAWGLASRDLAGRPARTVGQIVGRLRQLPDDGPGDPGRRWRFLLWLSQRAGWISRDGWPTPDEDAVERLLREPAELPALALSAGPVSDGGQSARDDQMGARRRQADALHLLSELGADGWWSVGDLVGWLASELTGRPAPTATTRERSDRRRLEDQLARWLAGRWYWLGLVAWGWDGDGWGLVAPTDALRSLATGRQPAQRHLPKRCTVTGPSRFEVPPDADLATLFRAERYLAYTGDEQGHRRYGLTPASFDRGVRLGGDADELRGLLVRLLGGPVPADWLEALERWAGGSSRLTLGARLVLASEQPETLSEVLAVREAGDAVTDVISSRHALVDGEHVAGLLAELARAGLPVEIDPGLRVEPRAAGRAAALANGVAETAWVALEVLRRLAPELVAEQRDLQSARARLDAVLAAGAIEALDRRAASIVAAIANRRRPRAGRRVV